MKAVSLSVCVVASITSAYASFDLMLIGNNSGSDYRVSRWDPVNRVALGSFGGGIIPTLVDDVAVKQSTNTAYVLAGNRVYSFNYSTGEYQGVSGSLPGAVRTLQYNTVSDTITFGNGAGDGVTNLPALTSNLAPTAITFGSTFASSAPLQRPGSGNYFTFSLEGSAPYNLSTTTYSSSGTFLSVNGTGIPWSGVNANSIRDGAFSGTKYYGLNYDSATGLSGLFSSETSSGLSVGTGFLGNFGPAAGISIHRGIAAGHNGLLWMVIGNSYTSYIPSTFAPFQSLSSLGSQSDLTGIAVVVAPEPASLVSLGLAAAMMIKRRNSKRS